VSPLLTLEHWQLASERLYAPYKIAALVETLAESGIATAEALDGTGIKADELYHPATVISIRQFIDVCKNAIRLGDPSVPFRTGQNLHLSGYGMYGYALLCSLTFRDFLDFAVKYHALATPALAMRWREEDGHIVWFYSDLVVDPQATVHRFLLEMQYSQTITHMRDAGGSGCSPLRTSLVFPMPAHSPLYEDYLGCPVDFNAHANELHYDAAFLSERPHFAHRITAAILTIICDRLLDDIGLSTALAKRVCKALLAKRGTFPDIEQVAGELLMTSRSLRRGLRSEGTSFQEILTDLRCSLAIQYLKTTRLSNDDIASVLDFSDAANFRHAFKRWTNKTPGEVRKQTGAFHTCDSPNPGADPRRSNRAN
jgi:AraC-like DNA-binding protein